MIGPSALFILDSRGKVILYRDYRGDVLPSRVADRFQKCVLENQRGDDGRGSAGGGIAATSLPFFYDCGISNVWTQHNDVFLLLLTRFNSNVVMMLQFLQRLAEIFTSYFVVIEEETIRGNFLVIYELLDEVLDHGWPQCTEPLILKGLIQTSSDRLAKSSPAATALQLLGAPIGAKAVVPECLTSAVSWRREGIKHKKNEVFLDLVEHINYVTSGTTGEVIQWDVRGRLNMRSYLSGMPELKLGLNEDATVGGKHLEDVKFHQCVRLNRYESENVITFVPPDGAFTLMSYQLGKLSEVPDLLPPITIEASICPPVSSWPQKQKMGTKVDYVLKLRTNYKVRLVATFIKVTIPVSNEALKAQCKVSMGTAKHEPSESAFIWTIKQVSGGQECLMTANVSLPSTVDATTTSASVVTPVAGGIGGNGSGSSGGGPNSTTTSGTPQTANGERALAHRRPITLKFEIPYFTATGLSVKYLRIFEKSGYQALPWVRYISINADYAIGLA